MWSLGVILFQLIYGKFPFSISQGLLDFIHRVINEKVVIPSQPPMPNSFKKLIYGCLEKDK
jgi:serine/threonine protein kinase